jgi:hypothetical protein
MYVKNCPSHRRLRAEAGSRGGFMKNYYPQRTDMNATKYAKLLAFFWMYLMTIYLLSLWT